MDYKLEIYFKIPILKYLYLYYSFIKNCLMREMQFHKNFLLTVLTTTFLNAYFLVYYLILIQRMGNNFLGWHRFQMLFFMATEVICHSLFMAFGFYNVFSLPEQIRTGSFDYTLLKPMSPRFILSTRYFNFATFTQVFVGIGLAIYSLVNLEFIFDFWKIFLYIIFILNSVFIMYLIGFTIMVFSFFFVKISASGSVLPYRGFFALYWFARRPEEIYSKTFLLLLTYVLPLLLIVNVPAKWMVRSLDGSLIIWTIFFTPLFFVFTSFLWKIGLKNYQSASS